MLLALDPSITRCGVALFERGELVDAGTLDLDVSKENIMRRVADISAKVETFVNGGWVHEVVAEWPDIYKPEKSKGSPKHLVPLAGVCSAVAAYLDIDNVHGYLPREWTGQVPKDESVKGAKTSPRAKKIKRRLTGTELAVWDTQVKYHDTIDAIGIGLHHLGRFDRKRVWGRG